MLIVTKLILKTFLCYCTDKWNILRLDTRFDHSVASWLGISLGFVVSGEIPHVLIVGYQNVFRLTFKSLVPVRLNTRLRYFQKLVNACVAISIKRATTFVDLRVVFVFQSVVK